MTSQRDDETPIEREDGPEAADVPQDDPSGRVDGEDQVTGPDGADAGTFPMDDPEEGWAAP